MNGPEHMKLSALMHRPQSTRPTMQFCKVVLYSMRETCTEFSKELSYETQQLVEGYFRLIRITLALPQCYT